jgi:hypothetical protein
VCGAYTVQGISPVNCVAVLSLVVLIDAALADCVDRVLPTHLDHILALIQRVAAPNSLNPHVLGVSAVRFQRFVRRLRCVGLLGVGVTSCLPVGSLDISHGLDRLNDLLTIDALWLIALGVLLVLSLFLSVRFDSSLIKILSTLHLAPISFVGLVQLE